MINKPIPGAMIEAGAKAISGAPFSSPASRRKAVACYLAMRSVTPQEPDERVIERIYDALPKQGSKPYYSLSAIRLILTTAANLERADGQSSEDGLRRVANCADTGSDFHAVEGLAQEPVADDDAEWLQLLADRGDATGSRMLFEESDRRRLNAIAIRLQAPDDYCGNVVVPDEGG